MYIYIYILAESLLKKRSRISEAGGSAAERERERAMMERKKNVSTIYQPWAVGRLLGGNRFFPSFELEKQSSGAIIFKSITRVFCRRASFRHPLMLPMLTTAPPPLSLFLSLVHLVDTLPTPPIFFSSSFPFLSFYLYFFPLLFFLLIFPPLSLSQVSFSLFYYHRDYIIFLLLLLFLDFFFTPLLNLLQLCPAGRDFAFGCLI